MKSKYSSIIILLLLAIIGGVVYLAYNLIYVNDDGNIPVETKKIIPTIELSKEIDESNTEILTINVKTFMEDESEISEIILPDETSISDGTTETSFTVKKNGKYKVTVIGKNGESNSEIISVSEIKENTFIDPYIPEGFEHIGGTIESGYVIQDAYQNQYVWIPVESGKLTRNTMFSKDYDESSFAATDLVNSVAQYYGFYISRFEASQYEVNGEIVAASIAGKTPWTNINWNEALEYSKNSALGFGYTNVSTALISSYAWDTTLEWIDSIVTDYSSNTNYGNYSGTINPTGYTQTDNINNICDLAGNVREWTSEIYKGTTTDEDGHVIRGGSANLNKTPAGHSGYDSTKTDAFWGFRMVLYR